ncbi:MAG: GLPGLI family protein [Bacteroidota bacterium]|nr:GLPGLI family protein [Bacteroidota bacterium]
MKKLFFILILFLCVGNAFAQYYIYGPHFIPLDKFQTIDSADLKFTYKFIHVRDSTHAANTKRTDIQTLLIGKNTSKYFSQEFVDSCISAKSLEFYRNKNSGTSSFEIFKNYPSKKMTVTEIGGERFLGGTFIYEETLPAFNWEIKNDTATILSYLCQKAEVTFNGRTYEAWFTNDIPINNGPWKFNGLPGLILKVGDDKQHVVFECVGIEKLKQLESIKLYSFNYKQITRKGLDKLFRRFLDNPVGYMRSINIEVAWQLDPTAIPKEPYNPIELE